jgi:hypothetical protein
VSPGLRHVSFFFPSLSARLGDLRDISDGGSVDPEKNVVLFNAIKKARAGGVPKPNIESALQKVRNFFIFLLRKI